ncbi:amidohydrolase family protein [Flexivirga sp. ID2601S]|uniref:Amidohydrolase family protein n=1 Tax=Flexivirga aerilata TaxID=1656889 RepID=A0A849AFV1_9MICO|nr:amidohydrolase family protein [Flexivirga aerilata]NNG38757.1 amidohydrolase family protein [Flexivirga aerilata]
MTRVDAHHHLWDPGRRHYPFLDGDELAPIRQVFGLDELRAMAAQLGVDHTVLVQTVADESETREFLALAGASGGLVAGVVGWLDLTAPDLDERIAALRASPGGDLLVGIRHQIQDESDPRWAEREDVVRGVRTVGEAGLVYDLLVQQPQWEAGRRLVERCPGTRFVLDHAGKPPIASGELAAWTWWIADLARLPNLVVKVSGLVTEADWQRWTGGDLAPVVDALVQTFGPQRLIQGSDWPVAELAGPTPTSWAIVSELLAAAGAQDALGDNAVGWYSLAVTT